ncbi:hypothetical protein MKX08_002432 [Trichoderma sp. CBMAI-0020]|nr:hypothetical protein MKX08_002432 [Trichoderma sp. CBMAI-0020]
MYPKSFLPAKRNVLLHQQWNDAASSLRMQILEAASVADWVAIDILSVGLKNEFNNTLLIAVAPHSMSWHQGHALALRCKAILEEHGIEDVHCEIRESTMTFGDAPVDTPEDTHVDGPPEDASTNDSSSDPACVPSDFQLSSEPITHTYYGKYHAAMSDRLGIKISLKDSDSPGNKGLYLALSQPSAGDEPRVVVLTCRHDILGPETEGLQEYRHQESQPCKEVYQVPQTIYKRTLKRLPGIATDYRRTARAAGLNRPDRAASYTGRADKLESLEQFMDRYKTPASRVFGHLLYSPELACASDNTDGAKWLRDWALIELLPSRHQAQLSALKNKVFAESVTSFLDAWHNTKVSSSVTFPESLVEGDAVWLEKAVVPMEELFTPPDDADDGDEKALLVIKHDAIDGIAFGLGNTLKSIIRRTDIGGREFISEEWCITSATRAGEHQKAFSSEADSGLCILDAGRRVAGILTAGCGMNGSNTVTYAQPVERLLEDIRAHGYDVSLV